MTLPERQRLRDLAALSAWIVAAWLAFAAWSIFKDWQRTGALNTADAAATLIYVLAFAAYTPVFAFIIDRLPIRRPHRLRNGALLVVAMTVLTFLPQPAYIWLVDRADIPAYMTHPVMWLTSGAYNSSFFTLIILAVMHYVRINRENLERRQAEAELGAEVARAQLQQLRADLDPHFLFNSLNSVLALVRDEPKEAERMLRILADLLRRSFTWLDREITLREEVAFTAGYLEVQRMRFGDRLSCELIVPPSLETALVPPLIMQPLVENAVVHGVARQPDVGRVVVSAHSEGARLVLTVYDSGPGFEPESEKTTSIGIPNTRARLRLMYGYAQSLTFRRPSEGFIAEISLPLVRRALKVPA